ncbi:MAG: hypothetical protein IKF39_09060, partial [Oscillospiraceae bacterium]|nr:hypothetical protein [Oscillospiraceae bacterium]
SVRQATISLSLLLPATSRWSGLGIAIRFVGNYALWDFHPRFGTCPSYHKTGPASCDAGSRYFDDHSISLHF